MWIELIIMTLYIVGAFFFIAGSIGLLRFPDLYCRLHALTKADNVGLGCIAIGTALHVGEWLSGLKIVFLWILMLMGSSLLSFLIAQRFNHRLNPTAEAPDQ